MIIITAKSAIDPENIPEFRQISEKQVLDSRKEEGCVDYGYFEDAMAPGEFIFVEKWKDQAALDFHFAQDYCLTFIKRARELTRSGSKIEINYVSETKTIG